MATKIINFGAILNGTGPNWTQAQMEAAAKLIRIDGKSLAAGEYTAEVGKLTIHGIGVLTSTDTNKMTFTADSSLTDVVEYMHTGAVSTLTAVTGSDAIISVVNVAYTGTSAAETITANADNAAIVAGMGDDTLIVNNVDNATLTGGAGADLFDVKGAVANAIITDYKYIDGDVLDAARIQVDAAGVIYGDNIKASVSKATNNNGVYQVKDAQGNEYWTTAADVNVINLDASTVKGSVYFTGLTGATNTTISTGTGTDLISVTGTGNNAIWAGAGNDSIALGSGGNDTVWFGGADGSDTVSNFTLASDVINLYDSSISDVRVEKASSDLIMAVDGAAIKLNGVATNDTVAVNFTENGGNVTQVSYALAASQTLKASTVNTALYRGVGDTGIDFSASTVDGLKVDLTDTVTYQGINKITGGNSANAVYVGATNAGTAISLGAVTVAGAEVWGGGSGNDSITLSGTGAGLSEKIWFGGIDGEDVVGNFAGGFADSDDKIYIWDRDLSDGGVSIGLESGNTILNVGTASLNLGATMNQILIEDKSGNTYKTAFASGVVNANDGAEVADLVISDVANGTATYTAALTESLTVNLQDTGMYLNIDNINASAATVDTKLIGTIRNSSIDAGEATNVIWGGGEGNDTINLTAATNADTVWFGTMAGADGGHDSIVAYDSTEDVIYFWDSSLKDVLRNADISATNSNTVFDYTETGDKLSVGTTTGVLNVQGQNDEQATGMKVAIGAANLTYEDGTNIYVGTGNTQLDVAVNVLQDTKIYLDNVNVEESVNDIYVTGVNKFNVTGTAGKLALIGAAGENNSVINAAGIGANVAFWGGGASSDTFAGSISVDEMWFGNGDGVDIFNSAGATDKVILWSAATIEDIAVTATGTGSMTIATTAGDSLVINAAPADLGSVTFQVGTAADAAQYTFNSTTGEFVRK